MKPRNSGFIRALFALGAVSFAFLSAGCKSKAKVIDHVSVTIPENIELVDTSLFLASNIQVDFGGSFDVSSSSRNYGRLYLEPWTPTSLARVGFQLNTELFNDPGFNNPLLFAPTAFFPNGERLPSLITRPLAMVKLKNEGKDGKPIDRTVDVYTYIDVVGKEWLGLAVTLKQANKNYFPEGLVITQYLSKDSKGQGRVAVSVFGPKPGVPGYAGISVFVNVAGFLKKAGGNAKLASNMVAYELRKASQPVFEGSNAAYYKAHPEIARTLGSSVKALLESNNKAL